MNPTPLSHEGAENIGLHRLAVFTACCTLIFLGIQISLGALTVWTSKAVVPATAHVAIGALMLGTSLLLTLRAYAMASAEIPARSV